MVKPHFGVNDRGNLLIGNLDATELAERFGTPLYVMDGLRVRENYGRFYNAFASGWERVWVCYAYKANFNLAVCKILQSEGAGAETSSINELRIALRLNVPHEKIVLNGPNKLEEELELAIANEVLVNVDSMDELELVDRIASKIGKRARIGFRVNPDIRAPTHPHIATGLKESKFGFEISSGQALDAYAEAKGMEGVLVEGVHCHIGSGILDTTPFAEEAEKVMAFTAQLKRELGFELKLVDFGGGLGIPYKPEERAPTPEELASSMLPIVDRFVHEQDLRPPTLVFEPGRFITGDAGVLLLRVGSRKERQAMPPWVTVDAGINALIRPALYGAYHHIEVANRMLTEPRELVNVAGPLCEAGDVLGRERQLPKVKRGDLIAVFDVGAYGLVMSSQHTCHSRPAMVLVEGGKAALVRRRENYEDLTRLDKIPRWLG